MLELTTFLLLLRFPLPEAEEVFGSDKMGCVDLCSFQLVLRPLFFLLKFERTITAAFRVRVKHLASQMRRILSKAGQLFITTAVQCPVLCSLGLVGMAAG